MHRQAIIRLGRQHGSIPSIDLPPPYLAPSLHFSLNRLSAQSTSFSSTASTSGKGRDLSKNRGVSAIHRTGPRFPLGVSKYPLPKPVSPDKMERRSPTPDHGLWGFFPKDRQCIASPEYEDAHGRPWSIQELREKSWEDLHCLWWTCVKERNRIATSRLERRRLKAGYGDYEADARDKAVRVTQQCIKHVLRERWYAWEDARVLYQKGYRPEKDGSGEELLEHA